MSSSTTTLPEKEIGLYTPGLFEVYLTDNPELADLSLEEQVIQFRRKGVNHQTSWFRDWNVLAILREIIIPPSRARKIRLASIGCSRGNEPYSVILDNWESRNRLAVSCFDVDPEMISCAQEGRFEMLDTHDKSYREIKRRVSKIEDAVTIVGGKIARASRYEGAMLARGRRADIDHL